MRFVLVVGIDLLTGLPAAGMELCGDGPQRNGVVDGDTLWWRGEKTRILDLDAPELYQPACSAEYQAGVGASSAAGSINQGEVRISGNGFDCFGRTLASTTVNGQSVTELMIAQGVARDADRRIGWCP